MIIISPFARKLRNGQRNAKNYPHWREVTAALKDTIQIGVAGEESIGASEMRFDISLEDLAELARAADGWISVDNFFHHFCASLGKPGVAIFGKSDPLIFGHPQNANLLKGRRYLRANQWDVWENEPFDAGVFVEPDEVYRSLQSGSASRTVTSLTVPPITVSVA